jgi:hypothetical protein
MGTESSRRCSCSQASNIVEMGGRRRRGLRCMHADKVVAACDVRCVVSEKRAVCVLLCERAIAGYLKPRSFFNRVFIVELALMLLFGPLFFLQFPSSEVFKVFFSIYTSQKHLSGSAHFMIHETNFLSPFQGRCKVEGMDFCRWQLAICASLQPAITRVTF